MTVDGNVEIINKIVGNALGGILQDRLKGPIYCIMSATLSLQYIWEHLCLWARIRERKIRFVAYITGGIFFMQACQFVMIPAVLSEYQSSFLTPLSLKSIPIFLIRCKAH